MSDTLNTLVRLARFEVDERRRELKVVQDEEDRLLGEISSLEERIESEKTTAAQQPEYARAYAQFLIWARRERSILKGKVAALQPLMEHARDNLAQAFADQKKAEVTRDNRENKEKAERDRKIQLELDELAMIRHKRAQKD